MRIFHDKTELIMTLFLGAFIYGMYLWFTLPNPMKEYVEPTATWQVLNFVGTLMTSRGGVILSIVIGLQAYSIYFRKPKGETSKEKIERLTGVNIALNTDLRYATTRMTKQTEKLIKLMAIAESNRCPTCLKLEGE